MTPPTLPRPPKPFPSINVHVLGVTTPLHRTHGRALAADQFNPGLGQPTRFAPLAVGKGPMVETLYAGSSREAAAFESIFHDIEPTAQFKTVRLDEVQARMVSQIAPTRALRLAKLFAPDLKAWGLSRTDLIETPKSTYVQTVLWADAIHAADPTLDGLIWTSRQCDPDLAMMFFGDRVRKGDLAVINELDVALDAALLLELRGYAVRAGITIVA